LRIEDTDQTRIVPGAVESLVDDLRWCGLHIKEGPNDIGGNFGPYVQSQRVGIYREKVAELIEKGGAYRCFCTDHRLDLLRKDAIRRGENHRGYDNKCRHLSAEEVGAQLRDEMPYVVRLVLTDDATSYDDLIFGSIADSQLASREGDPIILKSDGFPTYHLANVVDDHLMGVSHVLRGAEWLSSMPKHLLLYSAFDWHPPRFAHLPLIMNSDGRKLSKRNEGLRVNSLRAEGFLPETLLTFLCGLGGSIIPHSEKNDGQFRVHTLSDLAQLFDFDKVVTSQNKLDFDHLDHYARNQIKQMLGSTDGRQRIIDTMSSLLHETFGSAAVAHVTPDEILRVVDQCVLRIHKLKDLVEDDFRHIWVSPSLDVQSLTQNLMEVVGDKELLQSVLSVIQSNKLSTLNKELKKMCKMYNNVSYKDVMASVRWCITGNIQGPSIVELIELLGKDKCVTRISVAISIYNDKMEIRDKLL